jgi:alanyl-tRNA synthetase
MVEATAEETVKCLTTKVSPKLVFKRMQEIKALARPEFQKNPEKFYPVETFAKIGFTRAQCPKCQNYYWRHSEKSTTCGDSK